MELLNTFLISMGLNLIMFLPAYLLKTDKLTDISYAVTFVVVALYALITGGITTPSLILFSIVLLWAIRIGSYLLIRIRKIGKDKRFDDKRSNFLKFLSFWVLQGLTVWAILIPSTMFFAKSPTDIPAYAYIGLVIWLAGLSIETIADLQKYRFINNPKNKGNWIESGVWKYSRHPNYFGEISLWFGVYIFTVFSLESSQKIIGAISPLYIASLIIFISGIPLLEKSADKRWGKNPAYQEYKRRTSVLIPLPNKK